MDRIYKYFDSLADFMTRLPLVILILAAFMGYRYYEVLTLFTKWLPIEDPQDLLWAARLISITFIFSTLIFMVNAYRIGWAVKVALVVVSLVVNLYFWEVWTGDLFFKIFISAVNAGFDIGYAFLFQIMRKDSQLSAELSNLQQEVSEAEQELDKLSDISQKQKAILKTQLHFIKEHEQILSKIQCPQCLQVFGSPQALNAHQPTKCKLKPAIS